MISPISIQLSSGKIKSHCHKPGFGQSREIRCTWGFHPSDFILVRPWHCTWGKESPVNTRASCHRAEMVTLGRTLGRTTKITPKERKMGSKSLISHRTAPRGKRLKMHRQTLLMFFRSQTRNSPECIVRCAHSSVLPHFGFETLGTERDTQRGVCTTTAFGIQWHGKENLQGKFAQVYEVIVTSDPLPIHQERDWKRISRILRIRQEFKPQIPLQSSGMLLENPGPEEFSSYPQKASPGIIGCPYPGDLLLLLFQTMSLGICCAGRQPVILTPISRLLEQTPFDLRPFAFS